MNYFPCIKQLYRSYPIVKEIVTALEQAGAIPLLVGGAVRDFFLSHETKDFDIEIYHISEDDLYTLLSRFGPVSLVGKSFGVFKLHSLPIDWSLPRKDSSGRKPHVIFDPHLSYHDAFIRRDLTINAMGINLVTGELIDPFSGKIDLEKKILRTPDVHFFVQDPLRFFRVMQFIGRLEMDPDETLNKICADMDLSGVSRERISDEFEKLLLKSRSPSRGFRWLESIGRLHGIIPELYSLRSIHQRPDYHPEGDVFEHTMQTLDAAAKIVREYEDKTSKLILLFSALCHDIGKTGGKNEHGHDIRGAKIVPHVLSRLTISKEYVVPVQKLVRHHMAPVLLVTQHSSAASYKRLANALAPEANLSLLADLATADRQGRNPDKHEPLSATVNEVEQFKKLARNALVLHVAERQILQGKDLLDVVPPGKLMGELLKYAYEIQIEEGLQDKELLKERVLKRVEKK